MQVSSKLLLRTAIIVLGVMLMLGLYLSLSTVNQAQGTTGTDWTKVQGYINSYITNQYNPADEGEAGFYTNQANLKTALDSNGDGVILGEGDNLATAPVLVDNLRTFTTVIPGTSFRCNWNSDCFSSGSVADVKALVDAHEAATGSVPSIVDYCMTDHTAAPTTGAWGFIAQTGGLATDGSIPNVTNFLWGRDGWTDTMVATYTATNTIGAAAPSTGPYSYASNAADACDGVTPDSELVRCAANWAISSTGGNVGNGQVPVGTSPSQLLTSDGTATGVVVPQVVDARADSPASTVVNGGHAAIQVPINTLFNTGLSSLDPTQWTIVASRSQGIGGIAAEGLKMLGYNTAKGGYIHSGAPFWNNTMPGAQVLTGNKYSLAAATNWATYGDTDTVAPTISSSSAAATSSTTADVARTTSEVATTKIDLAGSDGSTVHTNDTILHASNTVSLTGLSPSTTYTGTLTVYDAQANASSTPISFTTPAPPCTGSKPALSIRADWAFWGSYADYTAGNLTVKYTVSNIGTENATGVAISGATATNGVTLVSGAGSLGNIAAAGSVSANLVYNVPTGVSQFYTTISGSAQDHCGATYTYP